MKNVAVARNLDVIQIQFLVETETENSQVHYEW
jgi:hypothetical protein